jgi:hypothetical protein
MLTSMGNIVAASQDRVLQAAFAGVAAGGVVIAQAERRRRACTPQEVRERLHARLAEAPQTSPPVPAPDRPDER